MHNKSAHNAIFDVIKTWKSEHIYIITAQPTRTDLPEVCKLFFSPSNQYQQYAWNEANAASFYTICQALFSPAVTGDANHRVLRPQCRSNYGLGGAASKVVAVPFVMTVLASFENMLIIYCPRPALSKQWWHRTLLLCLLLKDLAKRT
jgi:hypothetical protein